MNLTHHAAIRMQQRGIPHDVVDLILDFGHSCRNRRGSEVVHMTTRDSRMARADQGVTFNYPRRNYYLVLSTDGLVVTVGIRTKRLRRKG